jgi:peptidoglycan/LPS O-acetylase OafA/YrhL
MPHSQTRDKQNTALDGVRGFAALLVLLVHFHSNLAKYFSATPVLAWTSEILGGFGRMGVGIFYTMTGYFIYAQLMSKDQPYFQFVRRRIRRIYPVFFVVFCMYLALFAMVPRVNKFKGMSPGTSAKAILENALLLPGVFDINPRVITVAWTLSYIVLFYLTAPIIVRVFRLKKIGKRPTLLVLVLMWFAYAGASVWWNASPRPLMFFTGMVLYQVSDSRLTAVPSKRAEITSFVAVVLGLFFSWLYYSHRNWLYLPISDRLLRQLILSATIVPFLMYCIYHRHGLVFGAMSNRLLTLLGRVSYSWYLIQGISLYAITFLLSMLGVRELGYAGFVGVLIGTVLTNLAAAYILFRTVEKPFSIDVKKPAAAVIQASAAGEPAMVQAASAAKS